VLCKLHASQPTAIIQQHQTWHVNQSLVVTSSNHVNKVKNTLKCHTTDGGCTEVKGSDIYIPPLTGKPEQQRFTMERRTDQH